MDTNEKKLQEYTIELFKEEFTPIVISYIVIATILFWLVNHYDFYPEASNCSIVLFFICSTLLKMCYVYKKSKFSSANFYISYTFKPLTEHPSLKQEEFNYYQKIFKALDYVYMDHKIMPKKDTPKMYEAFCRSIPKRLKELSEENKWFFIEKVSRLKYDIPLSVIISSFIDKMNLEDLLKIKELYLDKRTGNLLVEEIVDLLLMLDFSTNNNKEKLELEIFSLYKKELPDFLDIINSNEKMDKRILNKLMLENNLVASDKNINKVMKI